MSSRSGQEGFTLIELMVVVLIIGILVTIAIPVFGNVRDVAQRRACFANERIVDGALQSYVSVTSAGYPSDWDGAMTALVPAYLQWEEVKCPSLGDYSLANGGTPDVYVTCSTHGTYRTGP